MQDRRSFFKRIAGAAAGVLVAAYCPGLVAAAIRKPVSEWERIDAIMRQTLVELEKRRQSFMFVSKDGLYEIGPDGEMTKLNPDRIAGETGVVEIWDEWGSADTGDRPGADGRLTPIGSE